MIEARDWPATCVGDDPDQVAQPAIGCGWPVTATVHAGSGTGRLLTHMAGGRHDAVICRTTGMAVCIPMPATPPPAPAPEGAGQSGSPRAAAAPAAPPADTKPPVTAPQATAPATRRRTIDDFLVELHQREHMILTVARDNRQKQDDTRRHETAGRKEQQQ